jgi:hypothetical protein
VLSDLMGASSPTSSLHFTSATISVRGEPLSGDRLAAWSELEGDVLAGLEHSAHALVEQLSRVALESSSA